MNRKSENQEMSGTLLEAVRGVGKSLGTLAATFGFLGVLSTAVGLILMVTISDVGIFGYVLLALGAGLMTMALITSRRKVAESVTGRRGRYSANTVVMSVSFVAIVAILNFVAYDNPVRMDVTSTQQFSLAPRTIEILKNLNQNVNAIAFFDRNELVQQASAEIVDNMLHEFDVRSDRFSYEVVNLDVEPAKARDYGANQHGQVVFIGGETGISEVVIGAYFIPGNPVAKEVDRYIVNPAMERDFVTPLLMVTGSGEKSAYFLVGHGEKNPTDADDDEGYFLAAAALQSENYKVEFLDLQNLKLVPRDSGESEDQKDDPTEVSPSIIIIAGPEKNLLPNESEALTAYLKQGGRMLLLLDPETPDTFREFLKGWGLELGMGNIVDEENFIGEHRTPFITQHNPNVELTRVLGRTFYPGVTSLTPAFDEMPTFEAGGQAIPLITPTGLALTSGNSWIVEDPGRTTHDKDIDGVGPFFTAVLMDAYGPLDEDIPTVVEDLERASYITVGDSNFATNEHFNSASNGDLFLNSVNHLAGDVALINIRPKLVPRRELLATPNEFDVIRYTSWFLLPGLMGMGGVLVWWRRR